MPNEQDKAPEAKKPFSREDWKGSFDENFTPEDLPAEVTEEIYWEFLEVLPPAYWVGDLFQVGEAVRHNENGRPCYSTFDKKDGKYFYLGVQESKNTRSH